MKNIFIRFSAGILGTIAFICVAFAAVALHLGIISPNDPRIIAMVAITILVCITLLIYFFTDRVPFKKLMKYKFILTIAVIIIFIAFVLAIDGVRCYFFKPLIKTWQSCEAFQRFCSHVKSGNWVLAQNMLLTDPDWFRVSNGKVEYWAGDVTSVFKTAEPNFWETYNHYIFSYRRDTIEDKVMFESSSNGGYAILQNEKIKFIKMP